MKTTSIVLVVIGLGAFAILAGFGPLLVKSGTGESEPSKNSEKGGWGTRVKEVDELSNEERTDKKGEKNKGVAGRKNLTGNQELIMLIEGVVDLRRHPGRGMIIMGTAASKIWEFLMLNGRMRINGGFELSEKQEWLGELPTVYIEEVEFKGHILELILDILNASGSSTREGDVIRPWLKSYSISTEYLAKFVEGSGGYVLAVFEDRKMNGRDVYVWCHDRHGINRVIDVHEVSGECRILQVTTQAPLEEISHRDSEARRN